MRVKPLTGNVLIELDAPEKVTHGGIAIPDHTVSAEEAQVSARMPTPPPAVTGKVVEIGPWPKLKNGMAVMPEFGLGARVAIRPTAGVTMNWETSGRLKMISSDDVLAVLC
jgi:co-chaperonin GroES (HSP10)